MSLRSPDQSLAPPDLDFERLPLVVILGPTAVGKTEISIQLAERFGAEIISADSRMLYRGMYIGTAKPTAEERSRVPHHLIDVADPDEIWSLSDYQSHAQQVIAEVHARNRLPFLVGGTGQYLRTITEGWRVPAVAPSPLLRGALERWAEMIGEDGLHTRLAGLDPRAAAGIDYRNLRRTVRALEVIFTTGKLFSDQRRLGPTPYRTLQLGIMRPREELYARVDARIDAMLEAGLVDEVQGLLERGYSPELPTLSAIGYREIIAYLQSEISLDEAIQLIRRNTRILVRRQANWFKPHDPNICWFEVESGIVVTLEATIKEWQ